MLRSSMVAAESLAIRGRSSSALGERAMNLGHASQIDTIDHKTWSQNSMYSCLELKAL